MSFAALRRLACQSGALQSIAAAGPLPAQLVQLAAFSSSAAAAASGKILGACIFERLPVVAPEPPAWETEFEDWQEALQAQYFKELPKDLIDPKQSAEAGPGEEGGSRWQPAPRVTEADRSGDRRTLHRRLDQRIFMLVRPAGKADAPYTFPSAQHQEGETIRQTAERVLAAAVNVEEVQPYFVGNMPAGHVETEAGTLFFNRCQLIQGKPSLRQGSGYTDFVWVAKDELGDYITHQPTLELLQKML